MLKYISTHIIHVQIYASHKVVALSIFVVFIDTELFLYTQVFFMSHSISLLITYYSISIAPYFLPIIQHSLLTIQYSILITPYSLPIYSNFFTYNPIFFNYNSIFFTYSPTMFYYNPLVYIDFKMLFQIILSSSRKLRIVLRSLV